MNLDDQLETLEETPQTDAEQIDEETEILDVAGDMDEHLGEDALESDQFHAYDSFVTENEEDYDGYDPEEVIEGELKDEESDILNQQGYHIEDQSDLEEEVIEMEIEDGDIYAYLVDEDDNEIGFVLIDENGEEQEYYYVDEDDDSESTQVVRSSDGKDFDLGITREGIAETTSDLNAIYKDGVEIAAEFKETIDDIADGLNFLKKK